MTSGTFDTKLTITTLATTSEPFVSTAELSRATTLLPSPPNLKTESASWHSHWSSSMTTPLAASATSAPAMLSAPSFFETDPYLVNGRVTLDDLEQFVHDTTSTRPTIMDDDDGTMDGATPLLQDPMPRSTIPSILDTPMLFSMDSNNNNDGGDTRNESEDFSFDIDDFVLMDHSYEPMSPPTSPFVLFPPL